MKQVYRDLVDPGRLLARERDVATGRRTAGREDKGRRGERQHAPRIPARSWAGLALAAVVVVAGGVVGAQALLAPDDVALPSPTAGTVTPVTSAPPTDAPATAILLDYAGGELVRHECSDAAGGGGCAYYPDDYTPLPVRCTADGCTVYSIEEGPIDGPLRRSGKVPAADDRCKPTVWTIDLAPVGEATTDGIRHPARIVGTVTKSRIAEDLGDVNCLGAVDEYRYDATPS